MPIVSARPAGTVTPPVRLNTELGPPTHELLGPSVALPVPVTVPDRMRPPSNEAVPETTSVPVTVSCSADCTDCTLAVVVRTVTTKVPDGRSMITVSPSPGTTPPLQFVGTSQKPLASTFQVTMFDEAGELVPPVDADAGLRLSDDDDAASLTRLAKMNVPGAAAWPQRDVP